VSKPYYTVISYAFHQDLHLTPPHYPYIHFYCCA